MVLTLRVLFVEDSESDVGLIIHHLGIAGYVVDFERVETSNAMRAALLKHSWDLIFSDYKLNYFDAAEALTICHKLSPDTPFIIVANELSDESIVNSIKAGAHDYLTKDKLIRLIPAVARELDEAKIRSEKRLTKIDLEQRKKHYRSFFKHDISGNYLSTPDGQIIDFNPAFAKLLGYESSADLSAINIREIFAEPSEFNTIIARLKKERNIESIEHELIRKDGKRIVCVENIAGIIDKEGELNHCLGYIIDITEQKHAETVLKESESRYRALFSEMMEGFALHEIICDKEGKPVDYRFLSVNPAFERITGLSAINLIDKTVLEVIPDTEVSWIEKYGEVALTSIPMSFEDYARTFDRFYRVVAFCPKKGQFATIITDITESKKAEELLRQSKNRLIRGEYVFKSGNWELDLESGIITASEGACRLYGIEGEKWDIETIKNIPLPEYRAILDNTLSLLINDGIPYDIEFKIRQQESGQVIDIHSIAEYDSPRGIIFGIIKDITERKNTEKELINREQRFRELANSLPVSVYEADLTGKITFANATAFDWFGYTKSEINEGFNIAQFILENERPKVYKRFKELLIKDLHTAYEYTAKRKDGSIFPALISSFAVKKDGIAFGIRGTVVDLSELKQTHRKLKTSEQTFTTLISNLPGFVYRCRNDIDWTMEYLSEGFTSITGYSIDDIVKYKNLTYNDIIHSDYRNYLWERWQVLLELKMPLEEEYTIITKEGEIRWVWERGRGIYNDDGHLLYLEGFITDITERKRADQIQNVLYDISTAVITTQNLEELIEIIRNQLGTLLDTSNFYVAFYDEASGMFHTPHAVDQKDIMESWPSEKSLTGYLIRQKKALLISAEEVRKLVEREEIQIVGIPSKLWLGVPLHEEKKIIGAFVVQSYDNPNAYTLKDVEMLEFISHQISLFVQRKRAEEELKASEELYRNLIERMPDGVYKSTHAGKFISVNPAMVAILGYDSKEDLMAIDITKELYFEEDERIRLVANETDDNFDVYKMKRKDGSEVWVEDNGWYTLDEKGNTLYHEGIIRDITERKNDENKLRILSQAVEQNPASTIITDACGNIEFVNTAFTYLTQYSLEEVINKPPRLFNPGHLPETDFNSMWKALIAGTIWKGEYQNRRKDGSSYWENAKVSSLTNSKGEICNYILIMDDITEKKKMLDDLIAAKNSAEESNRLKSAFLATMNHELRTPLNHILGFSELIMAGVVPEDNASFASSIQTSGQNLLSIIEDVFDLALVEQANIKLRNQTFSLMDHFMENKASFDNILRTSAKHEQIHLVFRPDTQWLSSYVTADRSKINQVLTNLFKNAVKFTHKGTIEFGYKIADEANLTFYIKDTGIGIAKEKQNIIFDFFRQGDDSYTRVYGGIGVGLAIARKITKILQGELTVVSEPGKGSTFALSIPVELSASKDDKNNNRQLDLFNR